MFVACGFTFIRVRMLSTYRYLEAAEGVVLIEKLFATTYNDFEKELQLCKRLNVPVVGCIVVR